MKVLSLIIPALFGGIFVQFAMKSYKTALFALAVCGVMMNVVKLFPWDVKFLITLVTVFASIFWDKKVIDTQEKGEAK